MKFSPRAFLGPLIKLSVFAAITVLATYVLGATIANRGFGATKTYRAQFTDVAGLLVGDDVRVAGVRVGQIKDIRVVDHTIAQVTFTVDETRPLPTSTLAKIRYRNLIGQRYLALSQGPGDPNKVLAADALIPRSQTEPALDLDVLFGGFKPLFAALNPDDVNRLSTEIIQVLQGESGTVEDLLQHTASLTTTIAGKDAVIGRTVDNLNSVLGTITDRDQKLSDLVVQLQSFVSGLSADRKAIGDSLTNINRLADTTAGLLEDGRPALKDDIARLGQLATNLNGSSDVLNQVLNRLPTKINTITRTASYGSWFNFYLCSLQIKVGVGTIQLPTDILKINTDQARCRG